QVWLVQSGPGVVRPRETLALTCAVSRVSVTDGTYYWQLIRQAVGKGLECMGLLLPNSKGTSYAPSLKGRSRIIISTDSSKNQFSLQLRSLTAADTGTYYCTGDTETQSTE
uniref:Ig-like domain-containing protein n=1 Tax=Chelonoidis abingdonii TaxID=106734 RepID=A0A8C0HBP7_CHEAB